MVKPNICVEVYQSNDGDIRALVLDDWRGHVFNIVTGLEHCGLSFEEIFPAMLAGFPDADQYDPAAFDGLDIDSAAVVIMHRDELIAETYNDGVEPGIRIYPAHMGYAAAKLFDELPAPKERFIVVDEQEEGDRFETVCNTPEEANAEARRQWEYLTPNEQKTRHVFAASVNRDDLFDGAEDEYTGEVDWRCACQYRSFPDAFDSNHL